MSDLIIDGTGKGYRAKVDDSNRLHTHAYTVTMVEAAALQGNSFNVSTGLIELTDTSDSAVFYIKNNTLDDLFFYRQDILIGQSAGGGVAIATISYATSVAGGTIVTDNVTSVVVNSKIDDSTVLGADTLVGGQGKTVVAANSVSFAGTSSVSESPLVLPPSQTLAVSIQPPAGNTSQYVSYGASIISNASIYGND